MRQLRGVALDAAVGRKKPARASLSERDLRWRGLDGGRQAVPGQNVTIQVNTGAFAPGGFIAFGPPQTTDSNASLTADVVRWAVGQCGPGGGVGDLGLSVTANVVLPPRCRVRAS